MSAPLAPSRATVSVTVSGAPTTGVALVALVDSQETTSPTYQVGQAIRTKTTNNTQKTPKTIQAFLAKAGTPNFQPQQVHDWDVSKTGNVFILDHGPALQAWIGTWDYFTQVTFTDGTMMPSNKITITVSGAPPGGFDIQQLLNMMIPLMVLSMITPLMESLGPKERGRVMVVEE